jgi:hypothetical protein
VEGCDNMSGYFILYEPKWSLPNSSPEQIKLEEFKTKKEALNNIAFMLKENNDITLFNREDSMELENQIEKITKLAQKPEDINNIKDIEFKIGDFSLKIIAEGYWPEVVPQITQYIMKILKKADKVDEAYKEDHDDGEIGISNKIDSGEAALNLCKYLLNNKNYVKDYKRFYDLYEYASSSMFECAIF